ncbi:MAG: hypothetical protein RLZZ245_3050 [Verrucomicrobiota bacterium]
MINRKVSRPFVQTNEPQASGPQRTTCAPCDGKTPSSRRKMTFKKAAVILGIRPQPNFAK